MLLRRIFIFLMCVGTGMYAQAQLCQGSLGDPIVNITFGSGQQTGSPLSAATTSYQFVTNDCPGDGFYTVRNRTNSCFTSSWHSLAADHTGDPDGYFMLVNASFQPSAFYIDTVSLTCSGTTYEFAAWMVNVLKTTACGGNGIKPNLTFNIEKTDGTVLQSYNTGNINADAEATWRQYGFFFSTPSGVNKVVLRITNNAPGGCGNDLALDDITFRPCGPKITSAFPGSGNLKELCYGEGGQVLLSSNVSSGYLNPFHQWQKSTNNISWTDIAGANNIALIENFTDQTPVGNHYYRLAVTQPENITSPVCRVVSSVLTVKVHAKPVTFVSNNGPACEYRPVILTATGGNGYSWKGVAGFTANGAHTTIQHPTITHAGTYYVQVTNAAGCKTLDSTIVIIHPKPVATVSPLVQTVCAGDSVQLTAGGGTSYSWWLKPGISQPGSPAPKAAPADSVLYTVEVSNSAGCKDTASAKIDVLHLPKVNAGPDQSLLEGRSAHLNGRITGSDYDYKWTPPFHLTSAQTLHPTVRPDVDTAYILTAVSNAGCGQSSDTVRIRVYKEVKVPNAFSPNGDGINDTWTMPALHAYRSYTISIYNRHGQVVYAAKNNPRPWDGQSGGKPIPQGTYYYIIRLDDSGIQLTGWVLIIR